jgi:hypothetical protein
MNTFKLSKKITIECEGYSTRYSWGHKAYLLIDGHQEGYKKITYYNRTWEAYTYQTILSSIVDSVSNKIISKEDKKKYQEMIKNQSFSQDRDSFKTVALIAKMGEVFGSSQKESNDWKARMLKAGLAGKGLIMPEDWDTLTENDKESRLNAVINEISK